MVCLWTETVDAGMPRDALPATVVHAGCLGLCCTVRASTATWHKTGVRCLSGHFYSQAMKAAGRPGVRALWVGQALPRSGRQAA